MEKEKTSNGKIVVIIILSVLLLVAVSYIGYDILFVKEESSIGNQKLNKNRKSTKEKELDIHSRLVQTLYHKVTSDENGWAIFWRYADTDVDFYHGDLSLTDFNINKTSEEVKMKLVALNLKDAEKQWIECSTANIPKQVSDDYKNVCYANEIGITHNDSQYGYTKSYVESIYKELYGNHAELDTSVDIYTDMHAVRKLVYINSLDMYVFYQIDSGGLSGPGGYSTKISKATSNGKTIKIEQAVTKTEYQDDSTPISPIISNYTLVYTFRLDSDGMYNFISRVKES